MHYARACARFAASLLALALPLAGSARAGDLFVPADHATIQAAIDASVDGDTIWVGPGTWPGALNTLDRDITIAGAGADLTIVDGQGAAQTLRVGATSEIVTVRDLALTGGVTGAATMASATLLLTNAHVHGNTGAGASGRIQATGCTISDNGGSGLSNFLSANGCTFFGNGGWGVEDLDSVPVGPGLYGCRFTGNALGGARYVVSTFSILVPPELQILYCSFVNDDLQVSMLHPTGDGVARFEHCNLSGGSIMILQGSVIAENSILRSAQPFIDLSANGGGHAQWCNIQGGPLAFSNIDADPLWVDPANGDLTLLPGSPCINAGKPPYKDADGTPLDLGALPYQPWTTLDGGVVGSAGLPKLKGTGAVQAGFGLALSLRDALPGSPFLIVVGLDPLGAPFKGGTMWPSADLLVGPLIVPASGTFAVSSTWPAGLPSGIAVWMQAWLIDPGAALGWAASDGLRAVQP